MTRAFLLIVAAAVCLPARAQAPPEGEPTVEQLQDEVQQLRSEMDRFERLLNSRQDDLEFRFESAGSDAFQRIEDLEGTRDEFRRQLELRVPSYEALPASSEADLTRELSVKDRLRNLIIFHGYLRSGFGSNGKGGSMEIFQAPGAPAKYRLGNEKDTYGEIIFDKEWSGDGSSPEYRGEVMIAFQTLQSEKFDPDNDIFVLRESFVEGRGFAIDTDMVFWVGQQYYDRHDIHINDYFYLDMTGYGGGVREIPLRVGTLDLAYLGGTLDDLVTDRGALTGHHLDMRWQDIPAPLGEMMLWMDLATRPGGQVPSGPYIDSSDGIAAGAIHVAPDVLGGFNKLAVLWGRDAAANFSTSLADPNTTASLTHQFIVAETLTIQPSDCFTMQMAFLWRQTENESLPGSRITWTSAGLRPILQLTEFWAVALEYGADHVDNEQLNVDGTLHKFTVAPMLRGGNQFFSRPDLRTYFTYAVWPDDFRGLVGGDAYAMATEGFSMGCQLETWW